MVVDYQIWMTIYKCHAIVSLYCLDDKVNRPVDISHGMITKRNLLCITFFCGKIYNLHALLTKINSIYYFESAYKLFSVLFSLISQENK